MVERAAGTRTPPHTSRLRAISQFLPILANVMDAFVTGTTAAVEEAKAVRRMLLTAVFCPVLVTGLWWCPLQAGLEGEELAQKTMELYVVVAQRELQPVLLTWVLRLFGRASVKVQDAQEAALTSVSMTKELFQACLTKYMSDARVQKTVMTAQQQAMQIVQDAAPAAQLS